MAMVRPCARPSQPPPPLPSCMFSVARSGGGGGGGGGSSGDAGGGARGRGGAAPARERPPQLVARRNARERRRVQAVNGAFGRLRRAVPCADTRGKRVSKVKTLHRAIEYIQQLQRLLVTHQAAAVATVVPGAVAGVAAGATAVNGHQTLEIIESPDRNKENSGEVGNRWITYEMNFRPASCASDTLCQLLSEFQDF